MKHRSGSAIYSNGHRICRLRPTLRPNIILRGNRHHQPYIRNSLYRHHPSRVSLRWLLRRQSHINTLLCLSLHPPLYHPSTGNGPPLIPPRNRIQQPHRNPIRHRQNPIPPLLHNQRHLRRPTANLSTTHINPIRTRPIRRP